MPCSVLGHWHDGALHVALYALFWVSAGPPHARSRFPFLSNCMTDGAGTQQSDRGVSRGVVGGVVMGKYGGGEGTAPASSLVRVRGRWMIQMLLWESTARPPTCPISQFLGSCFGQSGSTTNRGGTLLSPRSASAWPGNSCQTPRARSTMTSNAR